MLIKEFLGQAYRIDQRINSKLEQIVTLRELATKATATISDMPVSGTRNINPMEVTVSKIVDLEAEINSDIDTLLENKRTIMSAIKRVKNPELQTLLEFRYLCFKTWEQIAVQMDYDLSWIHRLHKKSLSKIKISH